MTLGFLVSQAVTRPNVKSRNLWCLFAKSSWNVNVLKILCICCCPVSRKYIAFLRFWSTWFEVSIVYWQKKQLRHSWNVSTLPLSLEQWARSCLFWIFISPFATLVDRAVIFRVFLFFLKNKRNELSCCFIEWSEFRDKILASEAKDVSTCKDYVIGREITTVREERNSWNMWLLWLLCYAFIHGKKQSNLIATFVWERKLLLIALLSFVSSAMGCYFGIVHVDIYPEGSSRLKPLRHLWLHHQSRVMVQ